MIALREDGRSRGQAAKCTRSNNTNTINRFEQLLGEDPGNLQESRSLMAPVYNGQGNDAPRPNNSKKQRVEKGPKAINISKEVLRAQTQKMAP